MKPKVGIIILNYNNYNDTLECLKTIEEINYDNYFVIVVDNASSDDSVNQINQYIEKKDLMYLICSHENLGYAGGNNIGIKQALKYNIDYLCILNNDTIVEKDFLLHLITYMEEHKECGVCGPAILEYDNQFVTQSSGGNVNFINGNITSLNHGKSYDTLKSEIHCDYVGGACMLIPKSIISKVGLIPEDYFLFFEETDWCISIKKIGYSIVCYTKSCIWHKGSASINKIGGLSNYMMERNRMYFVKKHSNFFQTFITASYLISKSILKGLLRDKKYFNNTICYIHGLTDKVSSKYDFVKIKKS